jgi:HlyD family secretion protein
MQLDRKWIAVIGGILLIALIVLFAQRGGNSIEYLTAKVDRGDIHDVVEATGTVHAVVLVQVGSQVSGTIAKLAADFNSKVHRGDVVALIDPALFKGALAQAVADLDNAKANVVVARENVAKTEANLRQSKLDYDRAKQVVAAHFQPEQFLDQAQAVYDAAQASVGGARAGVVQAEAQVRQKQAAVEVAKTNLDYTVIRSPIDGTVVARNVNVGQTVAASLQAPTIFDIAQDLRKMQLYAKTDESEVGRIGVGRTVTFKVDAFPHQLFHGVVSQLRMNPTIVQNVVTYDTIIDFDNPDLKLFPGMTAYVTIPVADAGNVLRVPNTSLRFEPPLPDGQIRAMYTRSGIDLDATAASRGANGGTAGKPRRESAVVWKLASGNAIEPVQLTIGITDHAYTEVIAIPHGSLMPGDAVVTAAISPKAVAAPGAPR